MNDVQEFANIIGAIAEIQFRFSPDRFPPARLVEVGEGTVVVFPVLESEDLWAVEPNCGELPDSALWPPEDYVQMRRYRLRIRTGFYDASFGYGERVNVIAWHDWGFSPERDWDTPHLAYFDCQYCRHRIGYDKNSPFMSDIYCPRCGRDNPRPVDT
jgi:hypothetical protein